MCLFHEKYQFVHSSMEIQKEKKSHSDVRAREGRLNYVELLSIFPSYDRNEDVVQRTQRVKTTENKSVLKKKKKEMKETVLLILMSL